MAAIVQRVFLLFGIVLDIIGLIGVIENIAAWGQWWAKYHQFVSNPLVLVPLFVVGNCLIAYSWGERRLEHLLKNAGGTTRREFPAHLSRWDEVERVSAWQVAWLWNDLEPQEFKPGCAEGTATYPTWRTLKDHLAQGKIKGAQKAGDSWASTILSRQQLIDYALSIGKRPKFLFPMERSIWPVRVLRQLGRNRIPYIEAQSYREMESYMRDLAIYLIQQGNNVTSNDIWPQMKHWIESGQWEAIGRKEIDGLLFDYEIMPPWKWEYAERHYSGIRWAYEEYRDVRVRQRKSTVEGHISEQSADT